MKVLAGVRDEGGRRALADAARSLGAEVVDAPTPGPPDADAIRRAGADVVVEEVPGAAAVEARSRTVHDAGAAFLVLCRHPGACAGAVESGADEWALLSAGPAELALRLRAARRRARRAARPGAEDAADLLRYEELLYDKLTGFPTLPVMIERAREMLGRRGELTILYIHFVWYEKIEELYGWQKLDDVLETTAAAVRDFYARENGADENLMMVSHVADDDFILFTPLPATDELADRRIRELADRLGRHLRHRLEADHGEDLAALCGIYVGASTVFRDPKIRTERLLYRGIREAAQVARGAEQWERIRKIADLKATLREEAIFMEYHPIVVTATEEIYGYEALARGRRRELRSPEVLFEVAEEANLIWELSRLLRRRAVQGIRGELTRGQFLFLNVDPHDFDDPVFQNLDPDELGIDEPGCVVFEITERIAIKDYPRFREQLRTFRDRGFRVAVDDAGSGYAGLGSIANLEPDYIKLDISLISNIDSNFLKQNLVETMVRFAEGQGAKVIAEGVERREEFETVRSLGVHLVQGFLFYRPRYAGRA